MIVMIPVAALIIWACLATISAAIHVIIVFRAFSGQEDRKAYVQAMAMQYGGVRRWIMMSLAYDILKPWLIWIVMLSIYLDERG